MPRITTDLIVTQTALRFFYQLNGACPGNSVQYGGQDGQYLNIEDATNPIRGIDPINVQDPVTAGSFRRIGRNRSAPDFPTATVQLLQNRGFLPVQFTQFRTSPVSFYGVAGDTKDLTDFLSGWDHYIKIYSAGEVTEAGEGGGSWDSGEQVQDDLDFSFEAIYNIGSIGFSDKASTNVYSEAKDVAYGRLGDGTEAIYVVTDNTGGSPGEAPSVTYRTKKDGDWTSLTITGAAAGDVPQAITIVSQYLVVVFDDGSQGGYFYSEIDPVTGVPGAFTKIQTGFVAAKAPKDIYAPDSRSIWLCGEGGYIYKTSSLTGGVSVLDAGVATSTDLNRIAGDATGTIVAVGESDAIILSEDRGNSWAASTAVTGGGNGLDAVEVVSQYIWWVGDDAGDVYYTTDGGRTWTDPGFLPSTIATVQDIVFATDEVGYILCATSGPAASIYTTWNGGEDWTATTPRIISTPTANRFNRLAIPRQPEHSIRANWLAIAGLAGDGTDGIVLVGEPKAL